ncbi:MAG: hypothetical protein OXD40_15445 [bacterium]|nr:hypothetical protein [bacterium]
MGLVGRPGGALDDLATAVSVRLESSTRGAELSFYATDIIYEEARGIGG